MCDDYKKIGKLYGIGIGPGDPKLLTLRAKEVLEEMDTIFVPKANEDGVSFARSIIEALNLRPKDFIELTFPMTKEKKALRAYWQRAVKKIVKKIRKEKKVAFVTIGDPLIYSTYIYLLKILHQDFPNIEVETIPGITAFNAAAARADVPLVEGEEKLAILPVSKELKGLRAAFKKFDTVVLMKIGSKLDKVVRLLEKLRLLNNSILISQVGRSNETIIRDFNSLKDMKLGYLSIIIVKCKQNRTKE